MKLTYSVVIASDRVDKPLPVLDGLKKLPASERPKEIFVCGGKNPSRQRNLGVAQCKSPVIYFLDDDSVVAPGTVHDLLSHFEDPRTAVAGGPNLVPPDAISFEKTVNAVLASRMGSSSVRFRYAAIGSVKEATEKDLILCNMMVRRETFLGEGGFRTDLYPNEENEFLNRLLHKAPGWFTTHAGLFTVPAAKASGPSATRLSATAAAAPTRSRSILACPTSST